MTSLGDVLRSLGGMAGRRTILGFSAAILLLAVLHQFWTGPILEENALLEENILKNQAMIETLERKIEKSEGLESELAGVERGRTGKRNPFEGMDPARAAGHLAERFAALDRENMTVRTYQVVSSTPRQMHTEVTVMLHVSATIGGLHRLLTDLERLEGIVYVPQIDVRATSGRRGPNLDVRLHLAVLTGSQNTNTSTASAS
jgi:hypothetical protein